MAALCFSHLYSGQTWESGWIFKIGTPPPAGRRLQTRDPVRCRTCHIEPTKQRTHDEKFSLQTQAVEAVLTLKAVRLSISLVTLSSLMVSVKAGHGDEWANLDRLENSGWLQLEHTYIPVENVTLKKTLEEKYMDNKPFTITLINYFNEPNMRGGFCRFFFNVETAHRKAATKTQPQNLKTLRQMLPRSHPIEGCVKIILLSPSYSVQRGWVIK